MKEDKLIIIASQPRSGSTLLQALLSNNNKVATVSEPWLLLPFLTYNKPELNNAKYSSSLAAAGINDFKLKINDKLFDNNLKNFLLSQYSLILSNREEYVLDKTPRYYEILDEIINYFPNAKIIILKRNPFSVLASIIKTWEKDNINKLLNNQRDILQAPFLLQTFSEKHINNSNVYTIKYEDIINDPKLNIETLYNWLGLDFNPHVLDYTKNQKFIGKMGDPSGIYQNKMPKKEKFQKWEEIYNEKKWKDFFKGYANYLTEDFLRKYGNYKQINQKETRIFNHYKERADWKFNEYNIPLKKILRNKFLRTLNLLKY